MPKSVHMTKYVTIQKTKASTTFERPFETDILELVLS